MNGVRVLTKSTKSLMLSFETEQSQAQGRAWTYLGRADQILPQLQQIREKRVSVKHARLLCGGRLMVPANLEPLKDACAEFMGLENIERALERLKSGDCIEVLLCSKVVRGPAHVSPEQPW